MYAVIKTGGKQYRVSEGDLLRVELLKGDVGQDVQFAEVLMIGGAADIKIGRPHLSGAKVVAQIVRHDKARKVLHFRKEKEGWTRANGHRQPFTEVKIKSIAA